MQSTARDFWKMIHDRKCGVVVMLSDLVEAGKVGRSALAVVACSDVSLYASLPLQEVCYQYWPSSGIVNIGEYRIDLLREGENEDGGLCTPNPQRAPQQGAWGVIF